MPDYLSVRSCISKTTRPNFTWFSVGVTCGRCSVLLWLQCDMLGRPTNGFVNDVSCFHIKANGPNQRRRVCFVEFARWRHGRRCLPSPTASYLPYAARRRTYKETTLGIYTGWILTGCLNEWMVSGNGQEEKRMSTKTTEGYNGQWS